MDLFDVAGACFRRWYIFLPILLAATWFAYSSYASVKPVYYANTVITVAPPNQQPQFSVNGPTRINGLLQASGPTFLTSMAVLAINDPSVRQIVVSQGGKADYVARNFPNPAGATSQLNLPLIMIEATEVDAESATKTAQLAAAQVDPALTALQQQAGVAEPDMVRTLVVSPAAATRAMPSRTRASVSIFLGGAGVATIAAVIAESVISRRRPPRRNVDTSNGPVVEAPSGSVAPLAAEDAAVSTPNSR